MDEKLKTACKEYLEFEESRNKLQKELFEQANSILGFRITDLMFEGTSEDLKQTKVTQPAIFLYSTMTKEPPASSLERVFLRGQV